MGGDAAVDGFEVEFHGRPGRMLEAALGELVGEGAIRIDGTTTTLSVIDQPALITVLQRLNDLGVRIERAQRARPSRERTLA